MTAVVTTRVPEETLREIDELSSRMHMDRATMLRNLIEEGMVAAKREKVLSQYKEHSVSLQKAAELLGIHLTEMIELIQREGLYLDYSEEELRDDLKGIPR